MEGRWRLGGSRYVRLIGLARPQLRSLVVAFLAGLVSTATVVGIPIVTKRAVDEAIVSGDRGGLLVLACVGLGLGLLRASCNFLRRSLSGIASVNIEADLRGRLFAHFQGLPISFHDRTETGQLLARATGDLNAIRMFLGFALVFFAYLVLTTTAVVVLLFALSPLLALLTLALITPFVAAALAFNGRMVDVARRSREAAGAVASVVEESAAGVRVVKAFGQEPRMVAKLEDEAGTLRSVNLESVKIRGFYIPALALIPNLILVVILAVGGWQAVRGGLSVGTLIAFNQALAQVVFPLRNVGFIMTSAQQATAGSARVFEVLDTQPDITDVDGASDLPPVEGEVRFEQVSVCHIGATEPALAQVDFHVRAGESVAIVGLSGSGKSTIASLIPRFLDPTSGRVLIDGVDVRTTTVRSLRQNVGVVFDDAVLFTATIAENIAFGRPGASQEEIEQAATAAGAHDFIVDMPHGYDTRVGESGFTLSGGQRQRLALARALVYQPRILVLDDPFSSVDVKTEAQIEANLRSLLVGRTTFLIAHRSSTVAMADRVLFIEEGRIVAEGSHADLLRARPAYRDVLAAELDVDELVMLEQAP